MSFKQGKERIDLYLVDVNYVKDTLAQLMKLKWNPAHDPKQPNGFMNYPIPANGLYIYDNFFAHYEAEHRIADNKDGNVVGVGISRRHIGPAVKVKVTCD